MADWAKNRLRVSKDIEKNKVDEFFDSIASTVNLIRVCENQSGTE